MSKRKVLKRTKDYRNRLSSKPLKAATGKENGACFDFVVKLRLGRLGALHFLHASSNHQTMHIPKMIIVLV